eukprot:14554392-Ditylum_brightwellii.AAC.2
MRHSTRKSNNTETSSTTAGEAVIGSEEVVTTVSGPSTRSTSNAHTRSAEATSSRINSKWKTSKNTCTYGTTVCQTNLFPDKTPDKTSKAVDENLSCEPTTKSTEESGLLLHANQHEEIGMYKIYPTEGVMTDSPFFSSIEAAYKAYTKLTTSE